MTAAPPGSQHATLESASQYYASCKRSSGPGRTGLQLLNLREYDNTVQDLLFLSPEFRPSKLIPALKKSSDGFDNQADLLDISDSLFEAYMRAAEDSTEKALATSLPQILKCETSYKNNSEGTLQYLNVYKSTKSIPLETLVLDANSQLLAGEIFLYGKAATAELTIPQEVAATSEEILIVMRGAPAENIWPEFRLSANGVTLREGSVESNSPVSLTVDLPASLPRSSPLVVKIEFLNDMAIRDSNGKKIGDRNLYIAGISVGRKGRYVDGEKCARSTLSNLTQRAYRRTVEPNEFDLIFKTFQNGARLDYENGFRTAFQAILISPQFLFRSFEHSEQDQVDSLRPLSSFELASRLSYFILQTMPDEKLMASALDNSLLDPAVLKEQIKRLLKDPKALRLIDSFAFQWLGLGGLQGTAVDANLFPAVTERLKSDMAQETKFFIRNILVNDLPLGEIFSADYSFLNASLAKHYGVSGPSTEDEFVRVQLPGDQRAGILSHASVLTINAGSPIRTSPINRGLWIAKRFLCREPPPPPADVPELNGGQAIEEGQIRAALEVHRSNPACFSCHALMDPIGLGLENFNSVGQYRTKYASGQPIDSRGELPGPLAFNNARELAAIFERSQEVDLCISEKMFQYALGRTANASDRCAIERLTEDAKASGKKFSDLVREIVLSPSFRYVSGEIAE